MSVWIVSHGERGEGLDVVSVHRTFEGAVAAALRVERHFVGEWIPIVDENHVCFVYANGCDLVTVNKLPVGE